MEDLVKKLKIKKPFFFDGAFGTYYRQLTSFDEECEYANLNNRDVVLRIHKEYIDSGVNAIKTNTYGANIALSKDEDVIKNIIIKGCNIAKEAIGEKDIDIFADMGCINSDEDNDPAEYIRIADIFMEMGINRFLFETFPEFDCLRPVLKHIKSKIPGSYIIVSFAVLQDGYTKKGLEYSKLIRAAKETGKVDVVGLNCLCGPNHLYELIKKLELSDTTISAMPNSGYPAFVNGRTFYQDNTDYFANKLADIYDLGVNILGGCCGTTPTHIRPAIDRIRHHKRHKTGKSTAKKEIEKDVYYQYLQG